MSKKSQLKYREQEPSAENIISSVLDVLFGNIGEVKYTQRPAK